MKRTWVYMMILSLILSACAQATTSGTELPVTESPAQTSGAAVSRKPSPATTLQTQNPYPPPLALQTQNPYPYPPSPPSYTPSLTNSPTPLSPRAPSATPAQPSPPTSNPEAQLPTVTAELWEDRVPFYIVDESLSWDPSSHWLTYTTSDGRAWLRAKNDHAATPISGIQAAPPASLDTVWSPNGDELLVYGVWGFDDPQWTAMWLAPVDETGAKPAQEIIAPNRPEPPVFQNEGVIYSASWAPDGERIAYSYQAEAWIYDVQTGKHEQVTQIVTEPLNHANEPFDGVREVAFSPDADYLAIGLTCNCPSPWMGVGVVDLAKRETRLIRGGQLSGWSPDGNLVIIEDFGEWGPDITFDVYGANPANGELTNLTNSNPGYDPSLDSAWDKPAPYQTGGLRFMPDGTYAYSTYDYSPGVAFPTPDFLYPAIGFIIRQSPETILLEKRGTANVWYIFENILPDGRVGHLEVEPTHPEPTEANGHLFVMRRVVYGQDSYEAPGLAIESAIWAPDGSALALVVELEPEEPEPENVLQILMLE